MLAFGALRRHERSGGVRRYVTFDNRRMQRRARYSSSMKRRFALGLVGVAASALRLVACVGETFDGAAGAGGDAASGADADADAASAFDGADAGIETRFCARPAQAAATFCLDFDAPDADLLGSFDGINADSGLLTIEQGTGLSAPAALRSVLTAGTPPLASGGWAAYGRRLVAFSVHDATLTFSVHGAPSADYVQLVDFYIGTARSRSYAVEFGFAGAGAYLSEFVDTTQFPDAAPTAGLVSLPWPANPWVRVTMKVVGLGTASATAEILYDGTSVTPGGPVMLGNRFSGAVTVTVGMIANTLKVSHEVWFDDVVLTAD